MLDKQVLDDLPPLGERREHASMVKGQVQRGHCPQLRTLVLLRAVHGCYSRHVADPPLAPKERIEDSRQQQRNGRRDEPIEHRLECRVTFVRELGPRPYKAAEHCHLDLQHACFCCRLLHTAEPARGVRYNQRRGEQAQQHVLLTQLLRRAMAPGVPTLGRVEAEHSDPVRAEQILVMVHVLLGGILLAAQFGHEDEEQPHNVHAQNERELERVLDVDARVDAERQRGEVVLDKVPARTRALDCDNLHRAEHRAHTHGHVERGRLRVQQARPARPA